MIDDIAEEAAKGIFRVIAEVIFTVLVEGLFFYTGEIILCVITLGNKKPKWNYYVLEKPSKFVVLTDISVLVGFGCWLLVAYLINKYFF